MRTTQIIIGPALDELKKLSDGSVQCVVTSPPYWGLRSYLPKDHPLKHLEIGCEPTPEEYVNKLVEVFREARQVLRDDGVMWLNLGDTYNSSPSWGRGGGITLQGGAPKFRPGANRADGEVSQESPRNRNGVSAAGFKPKDLIGIPWMVAAALRADGWYLRARCPWIKRNGMPESCEDRPTTVVEDIFLLSKSEDYFYDSEATRMPYSASFANDKRHATGSTTVNEKNGYEDSLAQNPKKLHRMFDKPTAGGSSRRSTSWFFESWQGLIHNEDGEPIAFMPINAPEPMRADVRPEPKRIVITLAQGGQHETFGIPIKQHKRFS